MRAESANGQAPASIALELLPFHKLAADKYRSLGMNYRAADIEPPSKEKMTELAGLAERGGVDVRVM